MSKGKILAFGAIEITTTSGNYSHWRYNYRKKGTEKNYHMLG